LEAPDIDVLSCHAFSHDLKRLAVCPNNEEVHIFEIVGEDFQKKHVLTKHTQRVTGLSWSCEGKLASVSEDRTAFVWELEGGSWKGSFVELRASRAALCVSWAPDGKRFAVGMSNKECAVCSWQTDMWLADMTGKAMKHKAAVTTVCWHPTGQYLAAGSTDQCCNVFSAAEGSPTFGAAEMTDKAGAWINSVAFSTSGQFLAYAPQDSTVRFKNLNDGPDGVPSRVRWRGLPFLSIVFMDDSCLVACGFDKVPVLFRHLQGSWQVTGSVDLGQKAQSVQKGAFETSRNAFKAGTKQDSTKESVASVHTNTITACAAHGGKSFSTSGLDGQVVIWELTP
jgi:actin related protein 2/3 complex subunit 1A/1B